MPHTAPPARRIAALLLLALVALAASATSSATSSAGDPNLTAIALAVTDFAPGAKVTKQRFTAPSKPATSTYTRVFRPGTKIGTKQFLLFESEVSLYADADAAAATVTEGFTELRSAKVRNAFAQQLGKTFAKSSRQKLKRATASQATTFGAGQSSLHIAVTIALKNGVTVSFHFIEVQTDRTAALMLFMPMPGITLGRAELAQLGQAQDKHFRDAFTVTNAAAPAIAGTATQTQVLTVSNGDWAGSPSSYAYQWSRCDAAGATCVDIAGATTSTYTVAPEDVGSTLRASVTAQNSLTSLPATSAVTTVVT
jgi:hypothetical protein